MRNIKFLIVDNEVVDRYYDGLTGRMRRQAFKNRILQALADAVESHFPFAILLIDLDNFKTINDSWGHVAGDEMLIETSKRLTEALPSKSIITRLGNDDFIAVLPPSPDSLAHAETGARKIIELLRQPYQLSFDKLSINVNIGIACYPTAGCTLAALFECADLALTSAQKRGRDTYQFYQENLCEVR